MIRKIWGILLLLVTPAIAVLFFMPRPYLYAHREHLALVELFHVAVMFITVFAFGFSLLAALAMALGRRDLKLVATSLGYMVIAALLICLDHLFGGLPVLARTEDQSFWVTVLSVLAMGAYFWECYNIVDERDLRARVNARSSA